MENKKRSKEKAEYKITEELGGLEILNAEYEKQNFSRHSHEGYTLGKKGGLVDLLFYELDVRNIDEH